MSDEQPSRYGLWRGLFMWLCVILIVATIARSYGPNAPPSHTALISAKYQRTMCDDVKVIDYRKKNPERFTVTLSEGCFGPRVLFPNAWENFEKKKSNNPGDYLSIWCNGHPDPGPIVPGYTDGFGPEFERGCYGPGDTVVNFLAQGKGTLTFFRTSVRQGYSAKPIDDNPAIADSPDDPPTEPTRKLKIIDMLPTTGANDHYSLLLKECHRSGEQILCSLKATNNTDANTRLWLIPQSSNAIDDEGNKVGMAITVSGNDIHLLPGVPLNYDLHIQDNHQNAKTLTIDLRTHFFDGGPPGDELVYKDVPIQ